MVDEGTAPGEQPDLERLDFAGLTERDANEVRNAIARGENFHGYIPAESLGFIIRNYRIHAQRKQALNHGRHRRAFLRAVSDRREANAIDYVVGCADLSGILR